MGVQSLLAALPVFGEMSPSLLGNLGELIALFLYYNFRALLYCVG